ncbi:hypothetical protein ACOXXE_15360 [Pseudomonas mediterranea]|uniref:hypothetical protein n=2 Tax=Pseudomonas TaxID=286 RepID=UPI003BF4CF8E
MGLADRVEHGRRHHVLKVGQPRHDQRVGASHLVERMADAQIESLGRDARSGGADAHLIGRGMGQFHTLEEFAGRSWAPACLSAASSWPGQCCATPRCMDRHDAMLYLTLKAMHIFFVLLWVSGMVVQALTLAAARKLPGSALPQELLRLRQLHKWERRLTTPAMVLAMGSGTWRWVRVQQRVGTSTAARRERLWMTL